MNEDVRQSENQSYLGGLARLLRFADFCDQRGKLLPLDFKMLPFVPQRVFYVSRVPAGTVRGMHAHHRGSQLLFCVLGRIELLMRVGDEEATVCLTDDSSGLLIGPGVWAQQTYQTENAVLMVLASEPYDPTSYIAEPRRVL